MFQKHKVEKAAKEYHAALAVWEDEDKSLRGMLKLVLGGGGPDGGGPAEVPLVLKKGERSVYRLTGGGLFEPRRGPGHYQGRSQGFSFPIGGSGVRYRIGQSRGTFVQGDESPTIIDTGAVVVTTQRVVFLGAKRTIEWAFSKLIAIQHYQNRPWTAIQVSNRQKVTGITYDSANEHTLRLRLEAAVALFNQETADLEAQLREAIRAHDTDKPREAMTAIAEGPTASSISSRELPGARNAIPSTSSPGPVAADLMTDVSVAPPTARSGWYPDPTRRHEYRLWDESRWTDTVADGGVEGFDPA